jgi:hypothetical protein
MISISLLFGGDHFNCFWEAVQTINTSNENIDIAIRLSGCNWLYSLPN